MAILTLAQAATRINDQIGRGIIQSVVNVNPMYNLLPFTPFAGQSLTVTPVDTYGSVEYIGVGDAITADTATTFAPRTFYPTTFVGKTEMNGLVQITSLGAGENALAAQLAAKSRKVGELFQSQIATGTGTLPQIDSLRSLATSGQSIDASGNAISFALLDELRDQVKSKGRRCDAFVLPMSVLRKVKELLRAAGGTRPIDINGEMIETFDGIPLLPNDYLSVKELATGVEDAAGTKTSVYAVNFDDGSMTTGISATYPAASQSMGFTLHEVGRQASYDAETYQVIGYLGFANFADLGLARLYNVAP